MLVIFRDRLQTALETMPGCAGATPATNASLTSSTTESTPIFRITPVPCAFTVRSVTPSSSLISLLSSAEIIHRKDLELSWR
jgi:hypothetical protein